MATESGNGRDQQGESAAEEASTGSARVGTSADNTGGAGTGAADAGAGQTGAKTGTAASAMTPSGQSPTASPSSRGPARTVPQGGRGPAILALLLALLALLASGALAAWLYLERDATASPDPQQGLQQLESRLQAELRQLREAQQASERDLRDGLREQGRQLQTRDQRLEALAGGQLELARRLEQLTPEQRSHWQLAEAEYLLQLAEQRLLMLRDPQGSLRLLRSADERLRQAADAGLYPVRERLAGDIAALAAVQVPDIEGFYLRLRALAERAAAMPLQHPPRLQPTAGGAPAAETRGARILQVLGRLGDQVRVQRRELPVEPRLDATREQLLRERLQLQFEQAGAALLTGREAVFRDNLVRLGEQLQPYANSAPEEHAVITAALVELSGETLRVSLPDISAARRELRAWLDAQQREPRS